MANGAIEVRPLPPATAQLEHALRLRPYQEDALAAIAAAEDRGLRRQLIALPTGTGKTVIFCELIRRRSGRVLVLVHRQELIDQTIEKLALIAPDLSLGVVKAERDEHAAQVVVASVQTISREARLVRLADFDAIIVDEAHHVTAESYQRVLTHFDTDAPLVLGFTATPYRGDGDSLTHIFPEIVFQKSLLHMIRGGYLSDLRALSVRLAVDFNDLHTRAGDFIDRECADLLRAGNAPDLIAKAYRDHAATRRGLLFAPTVEVAQDFADALVSHGINAACVHGGTPADERRQLLARFRRGEVQVIANCAVLIEGYDEPSCDCIVVARPTRSKPLYVQMLGRGTRRFPGKTDCLVLDVAGATDRHDLMTLASVFDLPQKRLRSGASVAATVAAYQEECTVIQAREADAARVVAQRVDLFQARPLNWVTVGASHFVLAVGTHGMVHVRQVGDEWRAMLHRPDGSRDHITTRPDMEYTVGAAEDFARHLGVDRLLDRDAPWRHGLATEKQLATLRKLRMRPAPALTRGAASDLIACAMARRFGR